MGALRAAKYYVVPETVTVAHRETLEHVPDDCEASLYFTVVLRHHDEWPEFTTAIRNAGIRVKRAQVLPADVDGTDFEAVWAWDQAELGRRHAEHYA